MHELSLCRSIYGIVDGARRGQRVEKIHLQVGQLRQVIPQTLEHCWGFVTETTALEGSRLEIEHVPVVLACRDCHYRTHAENPLMLGCSECGSPATDVITGEEFIVTTMDLAAQEEHTYG